MKARWKKDKNNDVKNSEIKTMKNRIYNKYILRKKVLIIWIKTHVWKRTATNEENSIWNKNLNGWVEEQIIHN